MENQQIYILDSDENAARDVQQLMGPVFPNVEICENAGHFYKRFDPHNAGCLITEFKLNDGSGLEVLQEINNRQWLLPAIVLSEHADVPSTVKAMQLGASAVIEKPYRDIDLWLNINKALTFSLEMREAHERQQTLRRQIASLTEQERKIVQLIVDGCPNKVIAARIDVSLRTVESRRKSIYQRLSTDNVAEFVSLIHQANTPICSCTLQSLPLAQSKTLKSRA